MRATRAPKLPNQAVLAGAIFATVIAPVRVHLLAFACRTRKKTSHCLFTNSDTSRTLRKGKGAGRHRPLCKCSVFYESLVAGGGFEPPTFGL